jgi:uncharacterized membrane protein YuzA (DUF378 family)
MESNMKFLKNLTLALLIIGAVNWGLVGLFSVDLVAAVFGAGSALARAVYILVGLSAASQLILLVATMGSSRVAAERG